MQKRYYLSATLLLLAACNKSDSAAEPQMVTTAFGQDFTLQYRQTATLPAATDLELTVRVEDLDASICPRNTNCFVPDFVAPTLAITGRNGETQLLKLPSNSTLWVYSSSPPDTTSGRANGRRYVVYYTSWGGKFDQDNPAKKDFRLNFRVEKPD